MPSNAIRSPAVTRGTRPNKFQKYKNINNNPYAKPRKPIARTGTISRRGGMNTLTYKVEKPPVRKSMAQRASSVFASTSMSTNQAIDFFDPSKRMNQENAITVPSSLGSFITLNALTRGNVTINTSLGADYYYIYQFTPSNISFFSVTTGGATSEDRFLRVNYNNSWTENPESVRSSRFSLGLQNITNSQQQDGSVTALITNNPLDWEFVSAPTSEDPRLSTAFVATLNSMTDSNPKSMNFTYKDFQSVKTFVSTPSSFTNYVQWSEYVRYDAIFGADADARRAAREAFLKAQAHIQRCSTIIIRIRATGIGNTYQSFGTMQMAGRYPSNTMLAKLEKSVKSQITDSGLTTSAVKAQEAGGTKA
jgi:hypothetical protein